MFVYFVLVRPLPCACLFAGWLSWFPANRICSAINSKLEFSTTLASRVLAIHAVNAGFSLLSSSLGSQLSAALIERGVKVTGGGRFAVSCTCCALHMG
jgi:hypothetical protein